MKKPVLVVMAAGMGSRYGGLKQIDPIDKDGDIIIDFSIYDAIQAGFEKIVFIIKKENEADFRAAIGDRMSKHIQVEFVFQDLHNLPEGMGMIVPLRSGGVSRGKALLLVALSGLPTLIGGIAGVLLGSISPVFIGFTLAFAAGCMLYVTYYEILPQVTLMDSGRRPLVFQLTGFLLGFVLISIMG